MYFFQKKMISYHGMVVAENEKAKISKKMMFLKLFVSAISGLILAMAFPPLNLEVLAFVAVVPMIFINLNSHSYKFVFGNGCCFGFVWSMISFWWLREINYIVPLLLSLILMLFWGMFSVFNFWSSKYILYPVKELIKTASERKLYQTKFIREIMWVLANASIYPLVEYIRINLFPWNFLGVSQYQNLVLIQIVEYTGIYGLSFIIIFVNLSFALTIYLLLRNFYNGKIYRCKVAIVSLCLLFICYLAGIYLFNLKKEYELSATQFKTLRIGAVQGDISQRRNSNFAMAEEALDVYLGLSKKLLSENKNLDIVIWPETAVPYPYWGASSVSMRYRYGLYDLIEKYNTKFLVGTLDFGEEIAGEYQLTNSAFLFNKYGVLEGKYDKIFRVPYGEFIPMRFLLPKFVTKMIDMGRDLKAGTNFEPIELKDDVFAGISICYESIFAKLWRREAQLGADIFVAINNDAWYPTSSEPEQHFANARFRTIENNRYAVRVGNNGGSLVVNNRGEIVSSLLPNLTDRGRKYGVLEVKFPVRNDLTFYTKYGDMYLFMLGIIVIILSLYAFLNQLNVKVHLKNIL